MHINFVMTVMARIVGVCSVYLIACSVVDGFILQRTRNDPNFFRYMFRDTMFDHAEVIATCHNTTIGRRSVLQRVSSIALPIMFPPGLARADFTVLAESITDRINVPLEYIPALSAYVVRFYLFGKRFGAIVDTGSPFLTVPSTCGKWGCYRPELTSTSGYANTIEGFDNFQGPVVWRKAGFAFDEVTEPQNLTFGVFGPELLDGPGGVFFGLIKYTDSWIRPSYLGQTGYSSFRVDLREEPQLVLSRQPLIQDNNYIPLVRELNVRYKAPVVHYTARAASFIVNGLPLKVDLKTPALVIFDTGMSGMAVSSELFDGRYLQARKNREKSLWGVVQVAFETKAGDLVELTAKNPLTTSLGQNTPLARFKGNLIVLGLSFLDGAAMTIDADDNKVQFDIA
mmetsp:Transcript_16809/g.37801  ORF Transcript_16809/g.37801 Transcript_16809/m.37801 type:complete len:398 (-) Transcript_16809:390-1583(-)